MKKKTALILGSIALLFCLAVTWFAGRPVVRFASDPSAFREWVNARGVRGRLAFLGMVFFQVVFALIPGEPFEIAAGYAFGALEGTALCILASGAGSMLVFFLTRRFGARLVRLFFPEEKLNSLRFLKAGPKRDLLYLLVFMLPGTPKDLLSYFAGLTDIRPGLWLIICTLGRIPSVVTSALGGDALGGKSYGAAAAVFLVTLAVSAAGLLLYEALCRKKNEKE